jgi:hypothetical protein
MGRKDIVSLDDIKLDLHFFKVMAFLVPPSPGCFLFL